MIERVYAPLKAEEKRQKVSKVIYDLITDDGLLNHASHSEIDEEIERIKEAIIEGKDTYRYKDKDLLMKALAKDSFLMANIRFVESK